MGPSCAHRVGQRSRTLPRPLQLLRRGTGTISSLRGVRGLVSARTAFTIFRTIWWWIPGLLWTVGFDTHSLARDPVYFLVAVRNPWRHDS